MTERIDPQLKSKIIELIRMVVTHPQSVRGECEFAGADRSNQYTLGDFLIEFNKKNSTVIGSTIPGFDFEFRTAHWPEEDREEVWNAVKHFVPYRRTVDDVIRSLQERFPIYQGSQWDSK